MPVVNESQQVLSAAAANLNNAHDELDAEIGRVEEGMRRSGISLEFWQVSSRNDVFAHVHAIAAGVTRRTRKPDQIEDGVTHVRSYSEIGFSQIEGVWRLAVRRMQNLTGPEIDFDREIGEPVPLVTAPLHVRMEAAQHFESFAQQLALHAQRLSAGVNSVKQLASI